MDWQLELLYAARAIAAALLGGLIGWERERNGHEAGIRTFATVALGACAFGLVSAHVSAGADPSRIAAQVVTGIGFLGAGVILHDRGRIHGLTTAATLWTTAAVGLAMAFGMYILGVLSVLIILALLLAQYLPAWPGSPGQDRHKRTEASPDSHHNDPKT